MRLILLSIILTLASCSGGGSGSDIVPAPSGETPPPSSDQTPSTSNTPPVLTASVSPTVLDERQTLLIEAGQSTDADGDPLTFTLDTGALPVFGTRREGAMTGWEIYTDEVNETATYTITVSASDGFATVSETFDITLNNYDRSPLNQTWQSVSETLDLGDTGTARFAENTTDSGFQMAHILTTRDDDKMEVLEFNFENGSFQPRARIPLDMPPTNDAVLHTAKIERGASDASFAVTSEYEERLWMFKRQDDDRTILSGQRLLPGLCSAAWTFLDQSPDGELLPNLLAGTDTGLWAFMNAGLQDADSPQPERILNADRFTGYSTGEYCNAGPYSTVFDAARNDFIYLGDTSFGAPNFPRITPVTVPDDLELVTFKAGKLKHQVKFYALLFAGAEHTSAHQLTLLHETPSGVIEQLDYALPSGIPADMVVQSIDTNYFDLQYGRGEGNRDTDIVIAVPATPYVYVIEVDQDALGGVTFGPLAFFEAGFDIFDLAVAVTDGTHRYSLITNDGYTLHLHESALQFSRF
ncbi:MAG: hypothetical protein AAFR51_05165 [Pseudomonadota bacterium]